MIETDGLTVTASRDLTTVLLTVEWDKGEQTWRLPIRAALTLAGELRRCSMDADRARFA